MDFEPTSIEEHIDCLARMTSASDSFITQVKELFLRKGIALDSEATPYLRALDEAFRREESIRTSSWRARQSMTQMQRHFTKLGEAYVKRVRDRHRDRGAANPADKRSSRAVSIPGDHRSYITRVQREDGPLVPGPEEIQ